MTEAYEISDKKRSKFLLVLSCALTVSFFVVFTFGHDLCRTGFPLTWFVIGVPILAALLGIGSLFDPKSSIAAVAGKLLLILINLCFLGIASIALVGMGIAKCG